MSTRHVHGLSAADSVVSGRAHSTLFAGNASIFANNTLPLPVRTLHFIIKAESFVLRRVPAFVFQVSGLQALAYTISDAVGIGGVGDGAGAPAADGAPPLSLKNALMEAFEAGNIRSLSGMFNFMFSRWAFACIAMAIVLNRVTVYASSRQRLILSWERRLALRILPLVLFVSQIRQLLQAIRCQTSPDFSQYRHGKADSGNMLDWNVPGGWLHALTSHLLFGSSDQDACSAIRMGGGPTGREPSVGSFSLLWPTFLCICLSQFIETISCSLQQLPLVTETALSVFEHSLAFAEAETMLYTALGMGLWGSAPSPTPSQPVTTSQVTPTQPAATFQASAMVLAISDAANSLLVPHALDQMNVPAEVLLVALLSCCNGFSSNVIAVFNRQRSLRLINTGVWAFCFMAVFLWGFFTVSNLVRVDANGHEGRVVSGLLHFPTVCVLGFLPHLLIIVGMSVCAAIYIVALLMTALSLGSNSEIARPMTFWQRLSIAHGNLQVALQVNGIQIKWSEDIYSALLRIGFITLTAASEAIFLNEGRSVEMHRFTWLEEERLDEVQSRLRKDSRHEPVSEPAFVITEQYGVPPVVDASAAKTGQQNGYANERKLKDKPKKGDVTFEDEKVTVYPSPPASGVGAVQRGTRFYLLYLLWRGILFVLGGWLAFLVGLFLDRMGLTYRPDWLRNIVGRSQKRIAGARENLKGVSGAKKDVIDFSYLTNQIELIAPENTDLDISHATRRRILSEGVAEDEQGVERQLDHRLYEWWKSNGWWGTRDDSGDYIPSDNDSLDDTTSVFSISTAASSSGDMDSEEECDGQRTPTPQDAFPSLDAAQEGTPLDSPLDAATLARLLNPPDRASKEEARMLAFHLAASSDPGSAVTSSLPRCGIVTRSQYRRKTEAERTRVLFAGRTVSTNVTASSTASVLDPAEESELLESLILARRQSPNQRQPDSDSGTTSTFLPTTSLCVVCQSSPRTIICWPCRCLCICEDCRVSLALNNFGNCVTCRRNLSGFVRLWVP